MLYMLSLRTNGVNPTGKQQFQIPFFTFISDQDLTIILKAEGLSGYMWVDLSFLLPIRLAQQLNFYVHSNYYSTRGYLQSYTLCFMGKQGTSMGDLSLFPMFPLLPDFGATLPKLDVIPL